MCATANWAQPPAGRLNASLPCIRSQRRRAEQQRKAGKHLLGGRSPVGVLALQRRQRALQPGAVGSGRVHSRHHLRCGRHVGVGAGGLVNWQPVMHVQLGHLPCTAQHSAHNSSTYKILASLSSGGCERLA